MNTTPHPPFMLELELTARCPLACSHCYSMSGPTAGHGAMATADWRRVIDQAALLEYDTTIQFIGGEPTSHPDFAELLAYAIDAGHQILVYSNLVRVKDAWWALFSHPSVRLATSYYSDQADEHDRITGRAGSHDRTRANIAEAVRRSIWIRAGIVEILDGQRTEDARADLKRLGVKRFKVDRARGVGRATDLLGPSSPSELCGHCGESRGSITPDGDVHLCVLSRFMPRIGNVRDEPLAEILDSPRWRRLKALVPVAAPSDCNPGSDSNDCAPAETTACAPAFD